MDRVRGLFSFGVITVLVLTVLRGLHLGVPLIFPDTRQGPIVVADLDEARRRLGFAPVLPSYRPAFLGAAPEKMTVTLSPRTMFAIVWRAGDQYLEVSQRRGGPMPDHPPLSQPLLDVPGSLWWMGGGRAHLVLPRGEFWISIETTLPPRDLKRFADTLTEY